MSLENKINRQTDGGFLASISGVGIATLCLGEDMRSLGYVLLAPPAIFGVLELGRYIVNKYNSKKSP